jgi:D-galactonate transporter
MTPTPIAAASASDDALYSKVTWRLIPFLMFCYIAAYLDRVNVGFAKLSMLADLGFSEFIYGTGAGIFFIGYFFFEVPSNLIMRRVGARVWIARIMITWGIISACFLFVTTPFMFYTLRFLLGVAEAGFYPGVIMYLTQWYPAHRRARVVALFMTAIPMSGIFGGPLSGAIMESMDGVSGWQGWQWLFFLEALPSLVLGVLVFLFLDDGIRSARWLSADEQATLERNLDSDRVAHAPHASLASVATDGRVWLLSIIYFACAMGQYTLNFWMPTIIRGFGIQNALNIGLLSAVPYIGTIVAMLVLGRTADRTRERRWHVTGCLLVAAAGLAVIPSTGSANVPIAMIVLTITAAAMITAAPLFWSLPTAFLGGVAAAAGIAGINSIGNLGGYVSPSVVGWLKDTTGSTAAGIYVTAVVVLIGGLLVLRIPAKLVNR